MVNFLKRKRKARPGILLYYNLLNTKAEAKQICKSCSCEELRPVEKNSESVERYSEIPDGENVESQNRDKAKARIEKLIAEIHDLMTVDELNRQRTYNVTELPDDKTNLTKHDNLSGNPELSHSCIEQDKRLKNDGDKSPLDIHELQSISAIAKQLNANTRNKSIPPSALK